MITLKKIAFLCVANSARSQMAEGLMREIGGVDWIVGSAGSAPGKIHPMAVEALADINIDASKQYSKSISELYSQTGDVDFVITLCQEQECPLWPGSTTHLHWPFEDPAGNSPKLENFMRIRGQIETRLRSWLESCD